MVLDHLRDICVRLQIESRRGFRAAMARETILLDEGLHCLRELLLNRCGSRGLQGGDRANCKDSRQYTQSARREMTRSEAHSVQIVFLPKSFKLKALSGTIIEALTEGRNGAAA